MKAIRLTNNHGTITVNQADADFAWVPELQTFWERMRDGAPTPEHRTAYNRKVGACILHKTAIQLFNRP